MNKAFAAAGYRLDGIELGAFSPQEAAQMGDRLAQIDPWARLDIDAARLARVLAAEQDCTRRFLVHNETGPLGAISIRHPFLYGPYIELLAVLPEAQGQGIGGRLVDWVAGEAANAGAREVWVAASTFNAEALGFYARHGFEAVGPMPDLVRPGFTELLLRRRIIAFE